MPLSTQSAWIPNCPSISAIYSHMTASSSVTMILNPGNSPFINWFSTIFSGSSTLKQVPFPNSLVTSIVPPIISTNLFVIAIPRPVPSVLSTRLSRSLLNAVKIWARYSGFMPIPVSVIEKRKRAVPSTACFSQTSMETVPLTGVNLYALDKILIKICLKRRASLKNCSCTTDRRRMEKCCSFSPNCGCIMATTFSSTSGKDMESSLRTISPLSILDISSTSLIRLSRCCPDKPIFLKQSFTFAGSSKWASAISFMPSTAFKGVLISWLILERKSDFARFASSAVSRAERSSFACASNFCCICRSSVSLVISI